jgi:ubiquinone biosynthesis protein COQ4
MSNVNQHPARSLLSSVLEMVETVDGDFGAIDRLAQASSDLESLQLAIDRLCIHPQVKTAFANRLQLSTIDLVALQNLPDNTLGYFYAKHMLDNQLKPLQSPPAQNDLQFLGSHITETHDLWHVITGNKTDILGEIQLESFYVAQLEVSRFWLALLTKNLLKSLLYDIEAASQYMGAISTGWLMGKKAQPLFGIDWNNLWATPIDELRASLNISLEDVSKG